MNKTLKIALAVVPFLLTVACTNPDKLPAEAAIKAAEAAAATLGAEVAKYAPEQVKAFQDGLAAAKDAAAKQDWKTARAAAEGLAAKAAEAVAAAKAKLEATQKELEAVTAQVGEQVAGLKAKVAELSRAKKLPAGITKDVLAKATAGIAEIEAAAEKIKAGAAEDAAGAQVSMTELFGKVAEIASSLKM